MKRPNDARCSSVRKLTGIEDRGGVLTGSAMVDAKRAGFVPASQGRGRWDGNRGSDRFVRARPKRRYVEDRLGYLVGCRRLR
jgi:hypothetical protein